VKNLFSRRRIDRDSRSRELDSDGRIEIVDPACARVCVSLNRFRGLLDCFEE
jgi:hypothetical protein